MKKEREQEAKRKAAKRDERPEGNKKANGQRTRKERTSVAPEPPPGDPNDRASGAARWGNLPSKLHQDAKNAGNQPPPSKWRRLIERYRVKLADADD